MSMERKIIFEQATLNRDNDIKILEESVAPNGQYKMVFRAKLQEAEVINNNKRVYPAKTLEAVYEQLAPKAAERKLVGEMDHPSPQGDQAAKIKRSSTISLQNACILIRELQWDGNSIFGIIETLTNRPGMDLYCLLKDGVTIGFSLRAFGSTKQRSDGVVEVLADDIKALTYDVVSNPSHDTSVILEFLNESTNVNELVKDLKQEILTEANLLKTSNNKTLLEETLTAQVSEFSPKEICLGNICTVAPLEEAVEYIIEQVVSKNSLPKIKVNKL